MKKKIVHIVGARPQFIKLAPIIHRSRDIFDNVILHTGQHYDKSMSGDFFTELEMPSPDYNLGAGSGNPGEQTAKMLAGSESVLQKENPAAVIVYGDTNSTLAGALASVKLNILTAHVEACLRSFNRFMPEEINRICTDHISNMLFAPTENAMSNARKEGLSGITHLVGDIMTDSLAFGLSKADKESEILEKLNLEHEKYCLLTLHRPYTVDNAAILTNVLKQLDQLEESIIFPVHPRTANMLKKSDALPFHHIIMTEPRPYLDFIKLMSAAKIILTDSGGIQKEAYILKKMCVTLRPETEWTETILTGWNTLCDPTGGQVIDTIRSITKPAQHPELFGRNTAHKIINLLDSAI